MQLKIAWFSVFQFTTPETIELFWKMMLHFLTINAN